jgi:hypothetical protein
MDPQQDIASQLKDIKPLMEIPDHSYYIYWGLIGLGIVLVSGVLFFLGKKWWEHRKINLEKGYLQALHAIDWEDTKKSAYDATHYGRLLATDERRREIFSQLEPMLEPYKYRKQVAAIDQETRNQFNLYVQVADESV